MIRVYIAAPWAEKDRLAKVIQDAFREAGFVVNASWIDRISTYNKPQDELADEAQVDLEEIMEADLFVLLNQQARGAETCGRAVETGVALMMNLPIIAIGHPTTVFHHMEEFTWVHSIGEAVMEAQKCFQGLKRLHLVPPSGDDVA